MGKVQFLELNIDHSGIEPKIKKNGTVKNLHEQKEK
jgi:hypothetical protein